MFLRGSGDNRSGRSHRAQGSVPRAHDYARFAMSNFHDPDPDPGSPTATRTCPACGGNRMRIVSAKPSRYAHLDECLYRCEDCGEEAEYVTLRSD